MKSSSKFLTGAVLFSLTVAACGQKPTNVEPLPSEMQSAVNQNLTNSRLPTVKEIEQGTVPAADDECLSFQNSLPPNITRDFIEVAEDPAQPDGQKIKIFYYGSVAANSTPIFFYNGGPASSSHGSYRSLAKAQQLFDPDHHLSFVFIDQRGTGCSDFYPQGDTPEVLNRLANYGSKGISFDSENIRKKLVGDKKIIPFGQSYGAFIVHRYMADYPKSLKAAFAHANAITTDGYARIKTRIASQARVSTAYFEQYPDDKERVQTLRDYLKADRCFNSTEFPNQKRCGAEILETITSHLLGFTDQWLTIHGWIGKMMEGSKPSDSGIGKFLATFVFTKNNPLNSTRWASAVIGYVDRNVPPYNYESCTQIKTDLAKQNINLDDVLFNECAAALQMNWHAGDTSKITALKTDLLTISDFVNALTQNPTTNFYAYSGMKDPYVPVENFAEEIQATKGITNFHYTNFVSTGHDGFKTEPLVWQQLLQEAAATN